MDTMKTLYLALAAFALASVLSACEDPIPNDYVAQTGVEAFLIVGQPIQEVKLIRSQSVADTFSIDAAFIKDADVKIMSGSDTMQLVYRQTERGPEYWYPGKDTLYKVQPNTTYELRVRLASGQTINGRTTSPGQIAFLRVIPDMLQYPKDTVNLTTDETLRLAWTPIPGLSEYVLRVTALDTLEYGKYMTPPTVEKNRRIERFWEENAPKYDDVTRWAYIPATNIPGSWNAFKWFGVQEIAVFAPDPNFAEWFKQIRFGGSSPTYNRLLGSVNGDYAVGVFASASIVADTTFVVKNQP